MHSRHCSTCVTEKMKKSKIISVRKTSQHGRTVYKDISGPINPKSLGANLFAVHIIKTRSMS